MQPDNAIMEAASNSHRIGFMMFSPLAQYVALYVANLWRTDRTSYRLTLW